VGKDKKRHKRGQERLGPGASSEGPGDGDATRDTTGVRGSAQKQSGNRPRRSWMATHGRDLRFLVVFGCLMALYYLATTTTFAKETFFPSYLRFNARAAGAILRGCTYDVTVRDARLVEPRFSVEIGRGCDAVEPSALFVSAVLASPVPLLSRLGAAVVGTFLLMSINLIRVVTLLLTGIYAPRAFDAMHLDVWQALFILLAIVFWAVWASRQARVRRARHHVAT